MAIASDLPSNHESAPQSSKPAWQRASRTSIEAAAPVMGADSWPALSESTRASPKSSSSTHQGVVIRSNKSTPNHSSPSRHKSVKHGGSNGIPANGGPVAVAELPALVKQEGPETSPKVLPQVSQGTSDHRRGGNGGSHRGGFGNHRELDRGSYGFHSPRGFGGRDAHMQSQKHRGHAQPFLRPPPPLTVPSPFIASPRLVRPFVNPMGFTDIPSPVYFIPTPPPLPESFRRMPFVAHPMPPALPPQVFIPVPDHQRAMLIKQIEYYFSPENLCKDIFLRQNMDEQGWVPISLIAGFNRVKQLATNIQYILEAVRSSVTLEEEGEKIRRRNDWMNWTLLPSASQHVTTTYTQSVASMGSVGLEEENTKNNTNI